jgi:alpha-beta hydrolase superfamily lysophospholipase
MKNKEWTFRSHDDMELAAREWCPDGDLKAAVVMLHGLGEHAGRYAHVGAMLAGKGYGLFGFDLRGHGRSGGARGHVASYEDYMKDIDAMFARVRADQPGKPIFLYGHSLGGILVLYYTLSRKPDVHGAIVTSPGLRTSLEDQKFKVGMAKLLGALTPTASMPSGLDAGSISSDPEVVKKYREDPLVHDRVSFSFAKSSLESIQWVFTHVAEFPVPLLLMHGTQDMLARPRGSQEVADLVKRDCTLKMWEGMLHEIHNEPQKEQVFTYMLGWLGAH